MRLFLRVPVKSSLGEETPKCRPFRRLELGWNMFLRRTMPWLVCASTVTGVLLAVACQSARQPSAVSAPLAHGLPLVTSVGGERAALPASTPQGKDLDLAQFRPLLAEAKLQSVSEALVDQDPELAAQRLQHFIKSAPPSEPLQELRLAYLLASIQEQANQKQSALDNYERSHELGKKLNWPLNDEALIKSAQLHLQLQEPAAALKRVEFVTNAERLDLMELRAQIFDRLERQQDAEKQWALVVEKAKPGSQAAHRALLGHAQSLWSLASIDAAPLGLKDQAASALGRAQLGLDPAHPIYLKVEELKAAWQLDIPDMSGQALLFAIEELLEQNALDEALVMSHKLMLSKASLDDQVSCRLSYLRGKILAGNRKWGEAADVLVKPVKECTNDRSLHASLLFNAGKYSAADGRDSAAVRYYEELEDKYSDSSLADDARLRRAKSYKDMGSQAQFVALLSQMPEDYPEGDMTMEGVLLLAIEQMVSHKWAEATSVLERAAALVRSRDSSRGHEYAGTERYFLARCLMELGEEERALNEYESLIREVPLSYYMLHAYSRLLEADKVRAKGALSFALSKAESAPFQFPYRPQYDTPAFRRAMELLIVGDLVSGRSALLELSSQGADESLLWGIALLFDRAGDAHSSHQLARGRLTDWLAHYPQGDWRHPWEIGFPRPYLEVVETQSQARGVAPWLVYGVMREESTFVPDIVSSAKAYGLMQVIEPTARGIGKKFNLPYSVANLKQPRHNIAIGAAVLAELSKRFSKNPVLAIPGYNAGPGRPGRWLSERPNIDFDLWVELIPFRETRRYTKRVLASRAAYAFTYYRDTSDTALVLPKRLNLN